MGHSKQSTGEVEVDLGRYELRRSGRRIKIEKKPMELLIFLLERREQMVSPGGDRQEAVALRPVYRYRKERQQHCAEASHRAG